ncbi:FAD synthetase [Brevibacillus fluminis]|uniref:FAD synthase n=1 Tax=Brevibacillus fluminis TaxID=511487 RepID=A0A3M8DQQ9_9BACL|nr:FAD synthetase [Brevibacillus fluminis]RNB89781.1 FAD synthetase [Brevibacillus fluminis]
MHVHPPQTLQLPASVLTIGALDGVHRGHQELIRHGRERARELGVPLVVYTFDPPPRIYFQHSLLLTTVVEKIRRLMLLGVDHVVIAPFDANYVTRGVPIFLEELAGLNPLEIWEGSDFRFGRDRDGDIETLRQRFSVRVLDPVLCEAGTVISSSRIRTLLMQNKTAEAEWLLGWPLPHTYKQSIEGEKQS